MIIILNVNGEWREGVELPDEPTEEDLRGALSKVSEIVGLSPACFINIFQHYTIEYLGVVLDLSRPQQVLGELQKLTDGAVVTINRHTDFIHPLHHAVGSNYPEAIPRWIRSGVSVDVRDYQDRTPIHWISYSSSLESALKVLKELFAVEADVNAIDRVGNTALHLLCDAANRFDISVVDRLEIIKAIVAAGGDISIRNQAGQTPLEMARRRPVGDAAPTIIAYLEELTAAPAPPKSPRRG